MTTEIVNLRAAGTDVANPVSGTLIGTALLEDLPDERFPDDEAQLAPILSWQGRFFRYARGTFAFGGSQLAEYIEVEPVPVEVTLAKAVSP